MNNKTIRNIVEKNNYLKSKLFCRGFLFTNQKINPAEYPFYNEWTSVDIGSYKLIYHSLTKAYVKSCNDVSVVIIGNAFNPFTNEIDEDVVAKNLAKKYSSNFSEFSDYFNQLTGVFTLIVVVSSAVKVFSDAVGLYSTFYYDNNSEIYISSHSNLIGDLLELEQSAYMKKLKQCKTYKYFGYQLPGNITQFDEVKRVNPNHYLQIDKKIEQIRFYYPHQLSIGIDDICDRLISVLEKTMACIAAKWKCPAISLTGGCDSKTTLASSCKLYSEFKYFSYDSQLNEKPDADAAQMICDSLKLPFTYYHIPYDDSEFENIEAARAVLLWNCGDIRYNNPNDVRKRLYLDKKNDFDVEIKSWSSEVGRSRYSKRYLGKKDFGENPSARICTSFYKFLLLNRSLVKDTDKIFADFIQKYYQKSSVNPIPWQDQFYWEWHWPSRDGICLTCEQQFSDEITVPYNNRLVLELLLSVPEDDRINDTVYTMIRSNLDARIDEATASIVDVNHTKKRAVLETAYLYINKFLPY